MKILKITAFLSLLGTLPCEAQTTRSGMLGYNTSTFTNCGTNCITGTQLQIWNSTLVNSAGFLQDSNNWTGRNVFNNTLQGAINLVPSAPPSAPANGDLWSTPTGLFVQIGGISYALLGGGLSAPSMVVRGGVYAQPSYVDATGLGSAANSNAPLFSGSSTANSELSITVSSAPTYAWPEATGVNEFNGDFSRTVIPLNYTISGSCTLGCASTITIASTSPAGGVITAASTTAFTIAGGSCPAPYSGSPYGASVFFNVYDTTNTTRLGQGYCSGGVFTFSGTASGSMSSSSDTVTLAQDYQWNPAVTPFQMQVNIGSASGMNQETTSNGGRSGIAAFRPMVNHAGQGDAMSYAVWCNVTNMRSGATTFLANPACEMGGGNLSGNAPGAYLEGIGDLDFSDGGYDIAAIGNVYNFNRTNNTGALGTVWMGDFYTSYGSKAIDAGWVAAGKFGNVIDTVMATVSGAAVNLGYDQAIYFNSTATPINGIDWYGNVLGTAYMKYSSALGTLQIVSPTNVSVSGNLAVDNNLVAGFVAGTGAACTVASTCHNNAGRFTLGTSPASTIAIIFNSANRWYGSPVCFAQDETIHSPPVILVSSAPGGGSYNFYAVQGTMLAGDIISYSCLGITP